MAETRLASRRVSAPVWSLLVLAGVLLIFGVWYYVDRRAMSQAREDAEDALRLQVLASRLGAATIMAEYGDYTQARAVMSGVFDGIRNYGIEEGALPENYATVLNARDSVILSLDRRSPAVASYLVDLFFRLQLPIETGLDPRHIIPATDSGTGIAPPRRDTAKRADSSSSPAPRGEPPNDTTRP